jgi:hypothetical protein
MRPFRSEGFLCRQQISLADFVVGPLNINDHVDVGCIPANASERKASFASCPCLLAALLCRFYSEAEAFFFSIFIIFHRGRWKNSLRVSLLLADDYYAKDLRTSLGQCGTGQSKLHVKLGCLIPFRTTLGLKPQSF